jgi:hypothetical protein
MGSEEVVVALHLLLKLSMPCRRRQLLMSEVGAEAAGVALLEGELLHGVEGVLCRCSRRDPSPIRHSRQYSESWLALLETFYDLQIRHDDGTSRFISLLMIPKIRNGTRGKSTGLEGAVFLYNRSIR